MRSRDKVNQLEKVSHAATVLGLVEALATVVAPDRPAVTRTVPLREETLVARHLTPGGYVVLHTGARHALNEWAARAFCRACNRDRPRGGRCLWCSFSTRVRPCRRFQRTSLRGSCRTRSDGRRSVRRDTVERGAGRWKRLRTEASCRGARRRHRQHSGGTSQLERVGPGFAGHHRLGSVCRARDAA